MTLAVSAAFRRSSKDANLGGVGSAGVPPAAGEG